MTTAQKIIKTKVASSSSAKQLGNVSQACKIMGYSRDSVYRFTECYATGGEEALREISRRKPNLHNRVAGDLEAAMVALAMDQPARGQIRVANELATQGRDLRAEASACVGSANDVITMQQRLKALEAKVAQEGHILTEAQLAALERVPRGERIPWRIPAPVPRATAGRRIRLTWVRARASAGSPHRRSSRRIQRSASRSWDIEHSRTTTNESPDQRHL